MKRLLAVLTMIAGGCVAGGASAFAVTLLRPAPTTKPEQHATAEQAEAPEFVPADVLLPLVFGDGQLAGYATLKLQLRVAPGTGEVVKDRLPLLLNAINLKTYRTPLATGTDGRLPDLTRFRLLVQQCADQSLGKGTVTQVAITEARTS